MLGLSNLDVEQQMVGRTKQGELLEILQDFCHVRKMRSGDKLRKILRRGIPYEHSGEKGLLFNAYVADIESQFEFLQKSWANDFNKPVDRCGIDPIIGCSANPFIDWDRPGYIPKEHAIEKFVTTRGSVYAFVPSKSTLRAWSS